MGISKSYLKELAKNKKFGQKGYKELPNDQNVRIPVTGALKGTKEFYTSFMNSPRYQQMLEGKTFNPYGTFKGVSSDYIRDARLRNLQGSKDDIYTFGNPKDWKTYTGNTDDILGFSKSTSGAIYLNPLFYNKPQPETFEDSELRRETLSHEFSHSIDRPLPYTGIRLIPEEDIYEIKDRTLANQREFLKKKGNKRSTWEYLTEPTEIRARINSVRERLWKNGVDIGKKEITAEDIKDINTENLKDLRDVLKEEDIIWMLNNISKTESPQKEKYAQSGAYISTQGYKRNSPDVNNPYNVIPSNQITMKGVDFPVMGTDNMGYQQMMYPGQDYTFPGDYVTEFPMKNMGNKRFGQKGLQNNSERFLKNWVEKRKINDPYIQEAYAMDQPELIKRAQSFPPVTTVPEIGGDPYITGRYEANTGKVFRTPDAPPHVITHEQSHYLQNFPNYMRTVHKDIVANELKPVEELKGDYKEMYPYFSSPDEVHSRIMVLREKAGFKPQKPVTEKKLDKFLKGYKGDVDNINDLLELSKDKKGLLNMLNYMAKNDQPTEYYGQAGMQKPIVLEPDYDMYKAPKQGNYLLPDINRPYYTDEQGGNRSEYKMGFNLNGKETLLPSVVGGRQLSPEETRNRYYQTGLHMGQYNTPEEAEYAARLRTAKYNMLQDPVRFNASMFQMGGTMGIPGVNGQVVSSGPQPLSSVKKTRGPITKNKKGDIKTMSNQQVKQVLKYSKQKPNKI
jgi:hypothetical protein